MILDNLKFKSFEVNRDAILVESDSPRREVFVATSVMEKAFITRAWLDRTLIDCAVGKCWISAEVVQNGYRLDASKVWLSSENNSANYSKSEFKNFGLELSKPKKSTSAYNNLMSLEKVTGKLSKRFIKTEDSNPDLCNFPFDNEFLQKLAGRHLKNAQAIAPNGLIKANFTPDWRIVTGMGEASVYETNMMLHHIYGVPYIPASTVKGVLRHYLDEFPEGKSYIELIFGKGDGDSSTNKPVKGQCIFFDAFPQKAPRIELDVMTPHYPKYYSEGQPPADWQSPNPIHFLTVGKGTYFSFIIGLPKIEEAQELKSKLAIWLEEALQTKGIGAKTAVGYGYLQSQ
jgi:CRISPR type III-B/RAMP module RAMP protein Cmr6